MSTQQELLHKMPKDQLAVVLKPTYEEFYNQLTDTQKARITFEEVVDSAYLNLRSIQHSRPVRLEIHPVAKAGVSDCVLAIGYVVADAIGLVFGLLGVSSSVCRAVARDLMEELGEGGARTLVGVIKEIKDASGLVDKAKAIWKLISGIKNVVGIGSILKALKNEMSWWDWVKTGITATAQLVIWFASDGAAAIAEIALEGVAIASLVQDAEKVGTCC